MAIEKQILAGNGVPLTYHRVVSVNAINGNQNIIEVGSYINAEGRESEKEATPGEDANYYIDTRYYAVPYDPAMTITDAYDVVKQMAEFEGATNLLDPHNDVNAFASAVASGEMAMADVPEAIVAEVEAIAVADKPAEKEGFILKRTLVPTGYTVMWEFVEDPEYHPTEDGTYLHPFTFTAGMGVTEGKWYTNGDDIWECIKTGICETWADPEFFDVIA